MLLLMLLLLMLLLRPTNWLLLGFRLSELSADVPFISLFGFAIGTGIGLFRQAVQLLCTAGFRRSSHSRCSGRRCRGLGGSGSSVGGGEGVLRGMIFITMMLQWRKTDLSSRRWLAAGAAGAEEEVVVVVFRMAASFFFFFFFFGSNLLGCRFLRRLRGNAFTIRFSLWS